MRQAEIDEKSYREKADSEQDLLDAIGEKRHETEEFERKGAPQDQIAGMEEELWAYCEEFENLVKALLIKRFLPVPAKKELELI